MTWNYYFYCIVDLTEEAQIEECGEDIFHARECLKQFQSLPEYAGHKLAIQQQHFISRIVK